jgi:protein gp37
MNPQHTFIILTKMPERIDRPMPDNVWLGVSVTGNSTADIVRTEKLAQVKARIKFISFEPLLAEPWLVSLPLRPDWIIAGRLTGHGKIHDPKLSTIEAIVEYGQVKNIAIFLKDNLRDIWPDRLIQEFPR